MNYLAHAYLSFDNPDWITGNLVSDFIKGKKRYDYPAGIQQGISIHRAIDNFTDAHDLHRQARDIFRPAYRLYSGAFVDVAFDHFLANDHRYFAKEDDLMTFSLQVYDAVQLNHAHLPPQFHRVFENMRNYNWLYNYRLSQGIARSFEGLVYRSAYMTESATAFHIFEENFDALNNLYTAFFPELYAFIKPFANRLIV